MPVTPHQLTTRRRRVDFTFDGEPVYIEYYPSALSGDAISQLQNIQARIIAAAESEEEAQPILLEFGGWLSHLLASWDYLEDTEDGSPGQMVPLTPERIIAEANRFGDFVMTCATVAIEDYQKGKPNGATLSQNSGATS